MSGLRDGFDLFVLARAWWKDGGEREELRRGNSVTSPNRVATETCHLPKGSKQESKLALVQALQLTISMSW